MSSDRGTFLLLIKNKKSAENINYFRACLFSLKTILIKNRPVLLDLLMCVIQHNISNYPLRFFFFIIVFEN